MLSQAGSKVELRREAYMSEKRRVFLRLNEVAWSRNIAIIYAWQRATDFLVEKWDHFSFQSNGPLGKPETCVFCGQGGLGRERAHELGSFLADEDCFSEIFIRKRSSRFLRAKDFRPNVLLIVEPVPGSIDNVIFELAFGIGFERYSLQHPKASYERTVTAAESSARKLVQSLAGDKQVRKLI